MVQDGVKCSSLSSENAYSNLIWACLVDAIHLGSLEGNLKLMTEALLSSTLQADLLVLQGHSGFPVGVIEVKKPGAVDPLVETRIFGELFDYMMFLKSSYNLTQIFGLCGWRGYEREEKEGEREVDNLSTCGCVIQLYLWENTQFIEIREFGWGFLMLMS